MTHLPISSNQPTECLATSTAQEVITADTTPLETPSTETTANEVPSSDLIFPATRGLRWQKFAGVGPERSNKSAHRSISGEAVNSLGSLEAELMGTLWEIGTPATSMDVAEAMLYKRRAKGQEPTSFATVTTTLRRLTDKGLLTSEKGEQRTPRYTPTVGREEMTARILNNVSVSLLGQSFSGLLPKLLGSYNAKASKTSANEQDKIARLMRALQDTDEQNTTVEQSTTDQYPSMPEITNAGSDETS